MKAFVAGLILGVILLIVSLFLNNNNIIHYMLLLVGVVPMIISGLISGVFASGDRVRANYSVAEDFRERSALSSKLFLFGLPCLLAGIALFYI